MWKEKSYAKINVFLKVTGTRGNYHELLSRFVRLPQLFDTITFEAKDDCSCLEVVGEFSCPLEKNSISKAYSELLKQVSEPNRLKNFFKRYKIVVDKKIKECGGLGGGSSNAASFLRMTNDACRLGFNDDELAQIGSTIGSDVPFFVYNFTSANVKGVGEIVEQFGENVPDLEIFTPSLSCNTANVYAHYRSQCYNDRDKDSWYEWERSETCDLLRSRTATEMNDLCRSTVELYPDMEKYLTDGWFMTGSGCTVFRLVV